jgi:hypothetical protein
MRLVTCQAASHIIALRLLSLPQRTPKQPSSEPHGATRQQAIANTPAYQIPSVIVVFVVLVCKSHSQKQQEALNPLVTEERH